MPSLLHWCRALLAASAFQLLATQAFADDSLRVKLDWSPWGDQAPFRLAEATGLFKKYGLDVSIEDGNGSVSTIQIVGNGEFDVGHAALAPVIIARSKGLPIKAIAGFIQANDTGLVIPKDSNIKSVADLKGKRLAFTASSLESPFIDRFLATGHLKRDDVELLNVDGAAKPGMYITERADAAFSSVPFFVSVVDAKRASTALRFADVGLQFPSFGIFATEQAIKAKHEPLKRFVSVVAGCWAYIFNGHQDEAVQAIIAMRPQAKLDPHVLRQQIDLLKEYALTDATRSLPSGTMALADWQLAVKTLSEGGLLGSAVDANDVFTNELLDPKIVAEVSAGGPK